MKSENPRRLLKVFNNSKPGAGTISMKDCNSMKVAPINHHHHAPINTVVEKLVVKNEKYSEQLRYWASESLYTLFQET